MSSPSPTPASQESPTQVPTPPADPARRQPRQGRPQRPRLFTEPDPSSSPQQENRPPGLVDAGEPAGFEELQGAGSPVKPGSEGRSSRADAPKSPFTRAEMRRAIAGAVEGASLLAHEQLSVDEIDEELERWITSDDESAGLAEPLSGLASRRMNGPAGMLSPDIVDLVNALVVIAAYTARQLKLRTVARRLRRANAEPATVPQTGPTDPDAEPAAA